MGRDKRPDNGLARAEGETDEVGQIPRLPSHRRASACAVGGAYVRAHSGYVACGVHSFRVFHLYRLRYALHRGARAVWLARHGDDAQRKRAQPSFHSAFDRRRHRRHTRGHTFPRAGIFDGIQRRGRGDRHPRRQKARDLYGCDCGHYDYKLCRRLCLHQGKLRVSARRSAHKPARGAALSGAQQAVCHYEPLRECCS